LPSPGWARHYAAQPGPPPADRLFLEGLRVTEQLFVSLDFDFGDLDLLTLRLDHADAGDEVSLQT